MVEDEFWLTLRLHVPCVFQWQCVVCTQGPTSENRRRLAYTLTFTQSGAVCRGRVRTVMRTIQCIAVDTLRRTRNKIFARAYLRITPRPPEISTPCHDNLTPRYPPAIVDGGLVGEASRSVVSSSRGDVDVCATKCSDGRRRREGVAPMPCKTQRRPCMRPRAA